MNNYTDLIKRSLARKLVLDNERSVLFSDIVPLIFELTGNLYFVGGTPRSWLEKTESKDIDVSTPTSVTEINDLLKLNYPRISPILFLPNFGLLKWGSSQMSEIDINHLRKHQSLDSDDIFSAKCEMGTDIHDDYPTRDFSINAIYYSWKDSEFLDPCGIGISDLSSRKLRFVSSENVLCFDRYLPLRALKFIMLGYSPDSFINDFLFDETSIRLEKLGFEQVAKWISRQIIFRGLNGISFIELLEKNMKTKVEGFEKLREKVALWDGVYR